MPVFNPGAGGASSTPSTLSVTEVEIDFGSYPVDGAEFTITDAAVTAASKIIVMLSGTTPSGRDADELQAVSFSFVAQPAAGSFTLVVRSLDGFVSGKYYVLYVKG